MNKFKKILLGVASVLTLGALFTVSTVRVKAGTSVEEDTYTLYASDFFASTSDGTKVAPTNLTVTPVTLASASEYYVDDYGTNRANKNAAISNPSNFDTSNWDYEYYSGGTRTITINAGDNQSINCSIFGYGTSTSKSVKFGNEDPITCAAKNTVYEFSNSDSYYGSMSISVSDKITIAEIKVDIENVATYSVTFDSKGGSEVTSQSIVSGGHATKPANPSYAGHKFLGWYTSTDGGTTLSDTEFNFTTTAITSALTLFAKWEEVATYTVTFKKYSTDTTAYATISNIAEGESIDTTNWPTSPRVLNKSFVGWYDGDTEYTSSTPVTADTTLVAKFNELKNDLVVFGDYTTGLSTTATTATHNFIDGVDASGSTNKKTGSKSYTIGDVSFNGTTYSDTFVQCGELTFTLSQTAMVTFYGTQTNDSGAQTTYVVNTATNATVMNSFVVSTKVSDTSSLRKSFSVTLPAGTYKTVQSGLLNWYGIRVNQDIKAIGTTASVFAEKNTAGDTLRFVGTLTGITDLDNIQSVELILKKGEQATKKQIFLTTCYTSVTGLSADAPSCAAADGTYYVIYRLKGIKDVTGSFTKQLVITFTDGSTTSSEVTNFSLKGVL